jgi:hypothetical protein
MHTCTPTAHRLHARKGALPPAVCAALPRAVAGGAQHSVVSLRLRLDVRDSSDEMLCSCHVALSLSPASTLCLRHVRTPVFVGSEAVDRCVTSRSGASRSGGRARATYVRTCCVPTGGACPYAHALVTHMGRYSDLTTSAPRVAAGVNPSAIPANATINVLVDVTNGDPKRDAVAVVQLYFQQSFAVRTSAVTNAGMAIRWSHMPLGLLPTCMCCV